MGLREIWQGTTSNISLDQCKLCGVKSVHVDEVTLTCKDEAACQCFREHGHFGRGSKQRGVRIDPTELTEEDNLAISRAIAARRLLQSAAEPEDAEGDGVESAEVDPLAEVTTS